MTDLQKYANNLRENAVLFSVTTKKMGQTRKLKSDQYEVGEADKTMTKAEKVLLDCKEMDSIQTFFGRIQVYLETEALPSGVKRGLYWLPTVSLPKVEAYLEERLIELDSLVDELSKVYDDRVAAAKKRLGPLADDKDYPSSSALKSIFKLSWQYVSLSSADNLPPEIAAKNQARMEVMLQEAYDGTVKVLQVGLANVLGDLVVALEDGKIFRDSKVENINKFLERLPRLNITKNKDIEQLAAEVKAVLVNVNPQLLRDDDQVRDQISAEFKTITKELVSTLGAAPKLRKFDF